MGWQIKEQRGNSTRREFSLSLFFPLFSLLLSPFCSFPSFFSPPLFALFATFFLSFPSHFFTRFRLPTSIPLHPDDCPSAPLSADRRYFGWKKDRFYISRRNGRKKGGKIVKQDRRKKGYVDSTYLLFDVFPLFSSTKFSPLSFFLSSFLLSSRYYPIRRNNRRIANSS